MVKGYEEVWLWDVRRCGCGDVRRCGCGEGCEEVWLWGCEVWLWRGV